MCLAVKVKMNVDFDTHYGGTYPQDVSVFQVVVTPHGKPDSYVFILLIPGFVDDASLDDFLYAVCSEALNDGDKFEIKTLDDDAWKKYDPSMPLLSFNPHDEEEWIWLIPPKDLRQ